MPRALLFPGQGAQTVGMGKALADAFPAARRVFEEADDVLGFRLSSLCWEGPEDDLTQTHNAQPAILTHSLATLAVVGDELGPVHYAAGHSLGEFSAHVAAGTMSLADGLRVVRTRGRLMQESGDSRPGTMAAVLGLEDEAVHEVCAAQSRPGSVCVAANLNSDGQVVISGDVDAVERVAEPLKEAGAKRVVPLNVSGAFHSPLMEPAQAGLAEALDAAEWRAPRYPVVCNVRAQPVTTAEQAREDLLAQLTGAVRWRAGIECLLDLGADAFIELGPGNVLTGLNRRNARGVTSVAAGDPESVRALLNPAGA